MSALRAGEVEYVAALLAEAVADALWARVRMWVRTLTVVVVLKDPVRTPADDLGWAGRFELVDQLWQEFREPELVRGRV